MENDRTIMRCPVCGSSLWFGDGAECANGHHYDRAKEGYVNLLTGHRPGQAQGDSREMARSRRAFLANGFFQPIADGVRAAAEECCSENAIVMDICCGEGYYTEALAKEGKNRSFYGFDLSREMVRLAAKRNCASFFVANLAAIPVCDESVDFAFHLFAPFNSREFSRILKPEGILLSVIPGRGHLMGLKKVLYATPYENDEKPPKAEHFTLLKTERVRAEAHITGQENIGALLRMTPYFYHTPSDGLNRLEALSTLDTELDFVLLYYQKLK